MPSEAFSIIQQAIEERSSIEADYKGHRRQMSPHVVGYKGGVEHALLYQYGGGSSSGLGPPGSPGNWRCLFVRELSNVTIIEGVFETAPNHSRPQTCVDDRVAVIDY